MNINRDLSVSKDFEKFYYKNLKINVQKNSNTLNFN